MQKYQKALEKFLSIVEYRPKTETMLALIIDSPWLPGYIGVDTRDFLFDQNVWLKAYTKVVEDLPGVVFIPGAWAELGMAAEPSGWGVKMQWHSDAPPSIHSIPNGLDAVLEADVPDPEKNGLMPMILHQYERMKPVLQEKGMAPRMAAARGPLAVASYLVGVTDLLLASQMEPAKTERAIEKTTELCIRWLEAQLERMDEPAAILVLDDVMGMIGPRDAERFAFPFLKNIFDQFPDLIHIFHNDTPNPDVYPGLAKTGMDVFNLTHEIDLGQARALVGPDVVLMGNVPPLNVMVRGTTDDVRRATENLLEKLPEYGPVLISPGGGVSPGTSIENLQSMMRVVGQTEPS